jgi:hypothetical protein
MEVVVKVGEQWEVAVKLGVDSEVAVYESEKWWSKWVQNLKWPYLKMGSGDASGCRI